MLDNLTTGDKAILKYLGIRLCAWILYTLEIIGFFGILGTVGGLERDLITIGQCFVQFLCILAAMIFFGFLVWVIEAISPYIKKEVRRIVKEEHRAEKEARIAAKKAELEAKRNDTFERIGEYRKTIIT